MPRKRQESPASSDTDKIADDRVKTADDQGVIEFTDREIELILNCLPPETSPEGRQRLEKDLRGWPKKFLPIYYDIKAPRPNKQHRKQAAAVESAAAALYRALAALAPEMRLR